MTSTAQNDDDNKKRQNHRKKRREKTDKKAEKEHCSSDSNAYYLPSESIFAIDYQDRKTLYHDTGCGCSVVNNLALLLNIIKVRKIIKTFGSPVGITHQGTPNLFGYHIAPVSFSSKGPVNLISVSQLVDHGIRPHYKNNNFLMKQGNSIVAAFTRDDNLYSNRCQSHVNLAEISEGNDWHTLMGHPSDKYLQHLLTQLGIAKQFTLSKDCEICSKSKIQRTPHKGPLPQTSSTFFKIHSNTLEISPTTKKGYRYILVLIDYYTRFNHIYLIQSKDQLESMIISYFNKIKNKLNITPEFLHSDCGGEFTSTKLKDYFLKSGTSIEQGAAQFPQTNGVAECFNNTLLSKIQCLLCQSRIPITYWDEAAQHASLLLNHTPHRFLKFETPSNKLKEHNTWLEPGLDYSKLIPFEYKFHVLKLTNTSKVAERTTMLRAMTNEQYSDAMRFLDIDLGKIVISRNFIVPSTFKSSIAQKQTKTLPNEIRSPQHQWVKLPAPKIPNSTITNSDDNATSPMRRDPEKMARAQGSRMKGWDYVPH
ncbi:hypothetical protein O181_070908 [Austropuccinia psidii MF-1]|uniref:Integrase catalytic domain-containing protein n=1 Tax=Austropuccinia psidii MF-1 TaxID=1389203 RepID=A0A9Q3F4R0_9BASI|nr:hypothetical protein [Austropuccinia psidii MF-1]